MYFNVKLLFILLFIWSTTVLSQKQDSIANSIQYITINNNLTYGYTKPKFRDIYRHIPKNLIDFGKFTIQKENLKWDALILGSTLAIIPYDQKILNDANQFGEKLGGWDKDSQYIKVGGFLRIIPKNIPSAVYYIGNGGTTLLLSGLFYGIGKIGKDDYRALTTSNELVEVLLSVGIATQTIKRISGRQSPSVSTKDGGNWTPFPSINAFQNKTPNYDAMPSGHLATYTATIIVIATNYPELKWIKPVGYTLGGIIAFNMVSTKVHWTSDYPIAILIGYVMGKNIANKRIIKQEKNNEIEVKKSSITTNFTFNRYNNMNIAGLTITF
ncbi:phosphatase PAP2 family protein [Flavobacterium sp.]|uniref:phosphatase PAP2 family protein n=1 Tax=Flavobacterium sp. TaxID=239 RepID=UPI0037519668